MPLTISISELEKASNALSREEVFEAIAFPEVDLDSRVQIWMDTHNGDLHEILYSIIKGFIVIRIQKQFQCHNIFLGFHLYDLA